MKKFTVVAMAMTLAFAVTACGNKNTANDATTVAEETTTVVEATSATEETTAADTKVSVMTYEEYAKAEINAPVVVETYVQAKQSWWDNKATFYTADENGAYFIYEMACTEEEYAKLTEGTKIQVQGFKSEWEGEVEIVDATYTIIDGNYVAAPVDVTELVGKDEIVEKQNQLVAFKGMTVKSVSYKNDQPGDDIYVTLTKDGVDVDFCLEFYLNGSDEEFYKTVGELKADQVVDVEGFLYWYQGANPHLTSVTVVK